MDPRRRIDGGTRTKPAPFQRPRIDLDANQSRAWRHVYAYQVNVADTVADFGLVGHTGLARDGGGVRLRNEVTDEARTWDAMDVLWAFTSAKDDGYPTPRQIKEAGL